MSGIVGVLNLDGSPVDGDLLGRMTAYLAFRGPDGRRVWSTKQVGFGHALLRITAESERDEQPFTLDGRRWIECGNTSGRRLKRRYAVGECREP